MHRVALALVAGLLVLSSVAPVRAANAVDATVNARHPLILVTFANVPSQVAGRAGSTGRRYTGSGYTIAQSAHKQAQRVAEKYSLHEVANWPIRALAVHCVVYEIRDNRPVASIVAALAKDPQVALAQPLQQFHTLTQSGPPLAYDDPLYDLQTNLVSLDIARAHRRSEGAGIRVALIDTGVDTGHPDLRNRISGMHSYVSKTAGSVGSYRHGTAMAGLIAAAANNHIGIVGIAPLAQVEVFEACWQLEPDSDAAACNTFTLAQAISGALDARLPLVNLSIAGPEDPLLSALVEAGLRRGVVFVGAATSVADSFPTGIRGVISVGGNDRDSGNASVTAPATHVLTLRPQAQYDFESGTSVAAAEVSGVVALLLANAPHLSADSIQSLLTQTAARSALIKTSEESTERSGTPGAVDANAALTKLDEDRGQRVTARSR